MTRAYPRRNPFPHLGTSSVGGFRIDSDPDDPTKEQPTFPLDSIRRSEAIIVDYVSSYNVAAEKPGQVVVFRGDHGSGKTHALRHLMKVVAAGLASGAKAPPFQIYVKAEGPDFLALYRRLTSDLTRELMSELCVRFLGVVASEQFLRENPQEEVRRIAAQKLKDSPDYVTSLFNRYLLDEGAVYEQQAKEIAQISTAKRDFQRALSYLLDPDLSASAHRWVTAQPMTTSELRKLGLSTEIASVETCKEALQLIAALFGRVGIPLLIYIDQYEKLVVHDSQEFVDQNIGAIQRLVEVMPRRGSAFVIAGNHDAWQRLPPDLKMRFAHNIIDFPILTLSEARSLVSLYLDSVRDTGVAADSTEEERLSPFTSAAVEAVFGFSSGNLRRFLQTCATLLDLSFRSGSESSSIDKILFDQALKNGNLVTPFDEQTLAEEVREIGARHGTKILSSYPVGNSKVDFAFATLSGDVILMLEITRAWDSQDEVVEALKLLDTLERVHEEKARPIIVLVMLGYVSSDVTARLGAAVDALMVYDPKTFRADLEAIFLQIPRIAARDSSLMQKQFEELRLQLEELNRARGLEAQAFESRLSDFFKQQAASRLLGLRDNARQAWIDERRRLEEHIKEVRVQRRQQEMQELERLRSKSELEAKHRFSMIASFLGLVTLVLAVTMGLSVYWELRRQGLTSPSSGIVYSLMVMTAFVAFGVLLMVRPEVLTTGIASLRALVTKRGIGGVDLSAVSSVEELTRLVRPLLEGTRRVSSLLRDSNPCVRFAGALCIENGLDMEFLIDALLKERSAIVRRMIAKGIARGNDLQAIPFKKIIRTVPETVYIVELAAMKGVLPGEVASLLPMNFYLAAVLSAQPGPLHVEERADREDNMAVRLALITRGAALSPEYLVLREAFERGIDRMPDEVKFEFGERKIRAAIRALSPFDEGGLGSFDDLENIELVDQLYMFFRQLLFFVERGLFS